MKQCPYKELEFYQCVANVVAATTTLKNFGSHANFEAYLGSYNQSSLVTCWKANDLKLPLLYLKSCSCSHIYAARVIFGHRDCGLSCKGNLVFLNLVRMIFFHYIEMFYTHFMHSCHKGCCIKKSMSYTF